MNLWPWQSPEKELKKRLEEANKEDFISIKIVPEDFFDSLLNRPKPIFYVRWYYSVSYYLNDLSWTIYRFFRPCHKKIRDSIPKKWIDVSDLIRIVNFQIIVSFYEDEYKHAYMEFEREFVVWLEHAYFYIKTDRNRMLDQIDLLHEQNFGFPFRDRNYESINSLEDEITNLDQKVLKNMMEFRAYFWT
jgi:hypothetical protein